MTTSKAAAAWAELNERQRTYLAVIYHEDQSLEQAEKSGSRRRGEDRRPAAEWRRQPLEFTSPLARLTDLQNALLLRDIRDPGTGSTVAALARRGLIKIHAGATTWNLSQRIEVPGTDVEITRAGRAAYRAGNPDKAPKKKPAGLLSNWLWRQLATVAAADPDGLADDLWASAHVYLGVGYRNGRNPSRGYIEQRRGVREWQGRRFDEWRWHLTDAGRDHVRARLDEYRRTYPAVPTEAIPEHLTAPASDAQEEHRAD